MAKACLFPFFCYRVVFVHVLDSLSIYRWQIVGAYDNLPQMFRRKGVNFVSFDVVIYENCALREWDWSYSTDLEGLQEER